MTQMTEEQAKRLARLIVEGEPKGDAGMRGILFSFAVLVDLAKYGVIWHVASWQLALGVFGMCFVIHVLQQMQKRY